MCSRIWLLPQSCHGVSYITRIVFGLRIIQPAIAQATIECSDLTSSGLGMVNHLISDIFYKRRMLCCRLLHTAIDTQRLQIYNGSKLCNSHQLIRNQINKASASSENKKEGKTFITHSIILYIDCVCVCVC